MDIYEKCISNPEILQHGQQYLSECLQKVPNFIQDSLNAICNPNIQIRKFIGVLFKNALLINWEYVQAKNAILEQVGRGLLLESDPQIQEILTQLLCEIIRREESYQLIPMILNQVASHYHLIHTLIYLYQNLDDRLNEYADQALQLMFIQPNMKLVYLIIRSFSHCEGTDYAQLKLCFDNTFDLWVSKFIQLLQSNLNIEDSIYLARTLSMILTDLKKYSKHIKINLIPHIISYVSRISKEQIILEEFNIFDEDVDAAWLVQYSAQLIISLGNKEARNQQVYETMLRFLELPLKEEVVDYYIDNDEPSIKGTILLFFEGQLSSKNSDLTKQFLRQFILTNQGVAKFFLLENFAKDLYQSNFDEIIQLLIQHPSLRSIHTATAVYIHGHDNQALFEQLVKLNIQLLNHQLGIVALYNIGRLCLRGKDFAIQIPELNFPFPNLDQDNAHIVFDSLLQILKFQKHLNYPIIQRVHDYWIQYPHDILLTKIFEELLTILAEQNWQLIHDMFNQTSGQIWLKTFLILSKSHPEALSNRIPQLCAYILQKNCEYLQQATMLLTQLLRFNPIDAANLNLVIQVLEFELSIHQDQEIEAATEHVHDLLLVVWNQIMQRAVTNQLLEKIIAKIIYHETPSTVQGLCTLLAAMYLQSKINIFSNTELAQGFLNKFLKYTSISQGSSLIAVQQTFFYQISHLDLDQIFFIEPYTSRVVPVKAKILDFLYHSQEKTIKLDDNDEEEFYDEAEVTDFEVQVSSLRDLVVPMGSLIHLQTFTQYLSLHNLKLN